MDRCPICLEEMENVCDDKCHREHSSGVTQIRCGHHAHAQCLQNSMTVGNYSCPICRKPFGDVSSGDNLDKALSRYSRMLKANLSMAVVRQRMVVDGVAPSVIDAFITGGASEIIKKDGDIEDYSDTSRQVVNLESYVKMLAMGISEGAVRQKMIAAGLPSSTIADFFHDPSI